MSIRQSFLIGTLNGILALGIWSIIIWAEVHENYKWFALIAGLVIIATSEYFLFKGDQLGKFGITNRDPNRPKPMYKWSAFFVGLFIPGVLAVVVFLGATKI
jgi:hypothetical protein